MQADRRVDNDPRRWDDHWTRYDAATDRNPAQGFRRRLVRRLLAAGPSPADGSILEIGCGTGDMLADLAAAYPAARMAGLDRSGRGLGMTADKVPGAILAEADLETETAAGVLAGWASHAVCSEVLEHVDDPVTVLRNIAAYLRPGGRLVVTVPGGPMSAFDRRIGHRRHFTADRLRRDLEAAGYRVVAAAGAGFPLFNLYRLVVIARGEKLAADIDGAPGFAARAAMAVFDLLLRAPMPLGPWGWQIAAVAEKPR